jgi:hypothetical protein
MNLLFERVRIQAQISRLYDLVGRETADQVIQTAWQIEQTRPAKKPQQQLSDMPNPLPAHANNDVVREVNPL